MLRLRVGFQTVTLCFLVSVCTISTAYPQYKTESISARNKVVAIGNYMSVLDRETRAIGNPRSNKEVNNYFASISQEKYREIAGLIFNASDANPSALEDSLTERDRRFMDNFNSGKRHGLKPAFVQAQILDHIKAQTTHAQYALIEFDYLMVIRVERIDTMSAGLPLIPEARKILVTASVTHVFKGAGTFKPGDQVTFYFMDFWERRPVVMNIGGEYLVPLRFDKALYPNTDSANGYYPIVDGVLVDQFDLFGFGQRVAIKTFQSRMDSLVEDLRTW